MMVTAPHMTVIERDLYEANHEEAYRGFRIKAKRDFGQYGYWSPEHRCNLNAGWVVCYGSGLYRICNAAPGATFAWTLLEAHEMIDDLIAAGFEGHCDTVDGSGNAQRFWELNYDRYGIAYGANETAQRKAFAA